MTAVAPVEPPSDRVPPSDGNDYDGILGRLREQTRWTRTRRGVALERAVTTGPEAPGEWASLDAVISRWCSDRPFHTALSDGLTDITYGALDQRADALAATLVRRGIGKGDIVALVMDAGTDFVVRLLAVWRAGAAFLPLSPAHPPAWLSRVARPAGVALVAGKPIPGFPHWDDAYDEVRDGARDGVRDGVRDDVREGGAPPAGRNAPGDLAYVIATSGSTGTPKLVMIEHRGPANLVTALRDHLGGVPDGARVLQYAQPVFDGFLVETVLALTNGGRLECPPGPGWSGEPLEDVLTRRRVTHALLPAAVLRTLRPGGYPDLRMIASVGDVCLPETARAWSAHYRFVNGYGPTEATVCTTMYTADGADRSRVPIGRPLTGCEVHILDEELRELPTGVAGEICIGGAGVGRGYLGRPELTARRFVVGPSGGRLYRSGDLGRRLEDGTIEFLGRLDDQVKVRGARVELGHVESALIALPGVRDAVAVIDRRGEPRLLAYVLTETETETETETGTDTGTGIDADAVTAGTSEALRAGLADVLPSYLVPDRIVVVDHWPLTSSGKVDRNALPRPTTCAPDALDAQAIPDAQAAPSGDAERAVAEIASELLGTRVTGVHDDLFKLGGNSLFAAQLVARLRSRLRAEVPLRTVLSGRTVAAVAAELGRASVAAGPGPRPTDAAPRPSAGQRRVWLLHRLRPQARAYHAQAVLRLAGTLDRASLEASLTDLVRRHDVLRSRFPERDGELTCVLDEPWRVVLDVRDLSTSDDQDAAVADVVRELAEAPFDLATERPFRWTLLRLGSREHLLVHVEHHVIHDGWSFRVLLRDLLDGYAEHLATGAISAEIPSVGYYDYARWQEEWLGSHEADVQRAFWRAELEGAPTVLPLPRRTEALASSFRGRLARRELDGELSRRIAELADRAGVSLFTVLLAAFFVLLHRYSGARDLLVGSAVANRRWRQTEDTVGMFVNTVVFRGDFAGDPTFEDFLRQIHRRGLAMADHQELPYDAVFEESPGVHGDGARPLIQTAFSFHDAPLGPLRSNPLDVTVLEGVSNGSAKVDLSVVATPRYAQPGRVSQLPGALVSIPASSTPVAPSDRSALTGITLAWETDSDLFDTFFTDHMPAAFDTLLRSLLDEPGTPVSRLPLVDSRTRSRLLDLAVGPRSEPPAARVPDLIDRWVRGTPDATAVDGPKPLTYAELAEQADRVARHLCTRGVGRGDVVAVWLPRGPDIAVTLLAVMKTGAASLPLDPSTPPHRLADLMADCGADVVVTTADLAGGIPQGMSRVVLDTVPDVAVELPRGKAEDACYVLYTSGSSGTPKGVVVPHSSVAARVWDDGMNAFRPGDVMLSASSVAVDPFVLELWGPLVHGAAVRFLPATWDMAGLARALAAPGVSHAMLSVAVLDELLTEFPHALTDSPLTCLVTGGDVVPPALAEALGSTGIPRVYDAYGPTETTVVVTGMPLTGWRAAADRPRVPIGRPLPNSLLYVLDRQGNLVPPGVSGEICVGGPVVARGYVGAAEGAEKRFEEGGEEQLHEEFHEGFTGNPYAPGRLYRTGDRGRWLADGCLEYLGRSDEQVKIRGFRVEPAEVRTGLLRLPGVRDAVVVADGAADRLVAHVLTEREGADVRMALAERLPDHLVPSVIMTHRHFPLTSGGKVDVRALPLAPVREEPRTEPSNDLETLLVHLVTEVCGIRPGVHDNLFRMGMHSLQAMRLSHRVSVALGHVVGLELLLTRPTVAELAEELGESGKAGMPGTPGELTDRTPAAVDVSTIARVAR
ncbi:amino acid adenylation domain-containing protein [Streptomyces sp. NPDC048297]|uniref:amino acid adenylation domain-containing protein n=1 Tax=Streptomyces sp. NPDC048297 TaxID=3365531 RepID=UPI0037244588